MARFVDCQDTFARPVPGDDDDDWGSDFEGELCSKEIEDNKINEIREANLLKKPQKNAQAVTDDNSQTMKTTNGNSSINAIKTGAIPKSGFSYLNTTVNMDANRSFQENGKEFGNNAYPQRQASQTASQSRNTSINLENYERQPQNQINSINEVIPKNIPRKLKPEAFSFLNKLPQRNSTENGNDINKERKTLVPTAFSHAEKLNVSQSQDDSNMALTCNSDASTATIPSAPPLENTSNNYEIITEESLSEFDLPTVTSTVGIENEKPPLPSRPPPVFKYPPETFSSSRSTSEESSSNMVISKPLSQSAPTYPKLGHSISSPESDLKSTNVVTQDSKVKNRKSLPSIGVCSTVPKRPLPPLPISGTENVSRRKSQAGTVKIESPNSADDEKKLETPTICTISSLKTNQFPECDAPIQHTAFKEPVSEEQLTSNPQHRLAQILTNQTSVDNVVLISQQKIASAITSRAIGSNSSSISRIKKTEDSEFQNDGKPKELKMIPRRLLENDAEQMIQVETERPPSYLEAKEAINPRRFNDHETLISAMNRPALPQKAPPMQRSVSCNSLVQSIKDLGFSVWSKPEKKRNSDGISLAKKNSRATSLTSSSKVISTAPLHITSIQTDVPSEDNNLHHGKNDAYFSDEKSTLREYPWFHNVDAKEGQLRLLSVGQDGSFLIRPSSRPTEDIQNTMCIFYSGKVRNLHIRTTADGRYVLGMKSNKTFSSLTEMIKHHKEIPVEILPQGSTTLKPQMYRILLRETPPKMQKLFAVV